MMTFRIENDFNNKKKRNFLRTFIFGKSWKAIWFEFLRKNREPSFFSQKERSLLTLVEVWNEGQKKGCGWPNAHQSTDC